VGRIQIKASSQLEELSLFGPTPPIVSLLHTLSPEVMENNHLGSLLPIPNLGVLNIDFVGPLDLPIPEPPHQILGLGEILSMIQLIRMSRGARKLRRLTVPSCILEESGALLWKTAEDVRQSGMCNCWEQAQMQRMDENTGAVGLQ
jgi:hypothetical protein